MTISAYTFKLPVQAGTINGADTVVVAADSAAHALELVQSHYPNVPAAIWAGIATPSAEGAAADYKGFRISIDVTPAQAGRTAVSGKKYHFEYTDTVGKTADQLATAIAAVMAASEPFANTTNAGSGVVTMSATDLVGDAVVVAYVDFTGAAAYDANINPNANNNVVHLTALAPTVQAVQINNHTRTVTTIALTNAPRVVGWFKDQTGAAK